MDTYIAIDLETTGLSPKEDRILEVGAVRVEEGRVTDTLHLFADPGGPVPDRITQITGITGEMLRGAVSQEEAVRRTVEFCEGMVLLGHNILFDYSFLKKGAVNHKLAFEHQGIDTLKLARKFLQELPSRSLECLCAYFSIDTGTHHRAVEDALAAKEVYSCLRERYYEGHEKDFLPGELVYRAKREGPITNAQKRYLNDLLKYHKIEADYAVDQLTKNEASRKIDGILSRYGRILQR